MADILVVDDEENLSYSIQKTLERAGHTCRTSMTVSGGVEEFTRRFPDLAVFDLNLPDGNGLDLMRQLHEQAPEIPVIVITSFGSVESAVTAMKRGAIDYVQKPLKLEELKLAVGRSLENTEIRKDLAAYRHVAHRESEGFKIVGECPKIRQVIAVADKIATVSPETEGGLVSTLILGETGTGKEVLARYLHRRSDQSDRPFIHVACTAIPESLFEAELFGHERGTFTDAKTSKKGLLELAHGGTLFLDEIGDMSLETQSKLLVAIESGRFRRLGGTTERVSRMRIIAATNCDLEEKISRQAFRSDLFFRLKVFHLDLPPLRERGDDVLQLTEFFLERFSRKFHKPIPELSTEAKTALKEYPWPGNVRELANLLQRATLLNDAKTWTPAILGLDGPAATVALADSDGFAFDFSRGGCSLASVEKQLLQQALKAVNGNTSEAARLVGLTRSTFRYRLQKHGLDSETPSV